MTAKKLTELIIAILENQDTQRIRFTLIGKSDREIPVTGARFSRVARAIRSGTIKVDYPTNTGPFAAFYHKARNTMSVGRSAPFSSRIFDALIVHESLHAAFDLNKSVMTVFEAEAAAYIAQGFYLKNSGYGGKIAAVTKEDGPVFIGYNIAKTSPENRVIQFDDVWVKELQIDLSHRKGYEGKLDKEFRGDH